MSTLPSLVPVKLFTSLGRKHWPLPRAWAVEVPAGCAAHPTSAAEPINERTSVEDLIMAIPLPRLTRPRSYTRLLFPQAPVFGGLAAGRRDATSGGVSRRIPL